MIAAQPDPELITVLRLAFGRGTPGDPLPLPPGYGGRGVAYALHEEGLPPGVVLVRYPPAYHVQAVRVFSAVYALNRLHFPAPPLHYFGWSRRSGDMLLLFRYMEGRGCGDQIHAFFARVGVHFAQMLAQLHLIAWNPLPDVPLLPFRLTFDDLTAQIRRLDTPDLKDILGWLAARVEGIEELRRVLLHGDYRLEHILAERTRVKTILGWERAAVGDPRFDVGYASAALGAYGLPLSDQFLDAYQAAAGSVPDLCFWEVFGALRFLTRVANTLSMLSAEQRERLFWDVTPVWQGLLTFAAYRAAQA